ncbi:M48 family metalloprotease [Nonomuraea sp. LPB2021202275-12-8]|uniref:M48 family metalloprotease n=1 Tax=Nonomuraea sp. LPB2021202275-12-8 TaxID=3120159 RepID=UPI00300D9D9D
MTAPDPFALPPPSTSRLRLLFLTVGAGTLFAGYWFLVLTQDGWRERNGACGRLAQMAGFLDCSTGVLVSQALASLAGPALVAALVVSAYAAAPAVITRWYGATPLAPWPGELATTVEAARLTRRPVLMVSDRGLLPRMFTYGRRPHYRIMLPRSVRYHLDTAPSTIVATLAHELGHLRNRDVDRTYLALFATACFALAVFVPVSLSAGTALDLAPALAVGWRTAVVTLLVAGTWAAVIRAREHDADLRAVQFRPEDMNRLLAGGRQERHSPLRLHPPLGDRREALRDPARLLRPPAGRAATEAGAAGVAAGVIVTELGVMLHTVLPVPPIVAYWIAGLVAAAPVCAIVGLGVWRGALAGPREPVLRDALVAGPALGAGLLAGAILAPRTSVQWNRWLSGAPDQTSVMTPAQIPPVTAIWMAAVLLLLTMAVTGWLALAARAWLPRSGPRAWPYAALAANVLFGVVFGTWFVAARLAAAEQWTPTGIAALVITPWIALLWAVLTLLALLCLWPLARREPLTAAAAAVVAAVLLVTPHVVPAEPVRPASAAELPDSTQAGAICLGLFTVGIAAFGAPGDHAARQRLGRRLRAADDPLLSQAGDMFLRGASTRSPDLAALAWTALVRRCDHLNRYPGTPVPDPPPPLPTESW